jgi:hypothetical protein
MDSVKANKNNIYLLHLGVKTNNIFILHLGVKSNKKKVPCMIFSHISRNR